MFVEALRLVLDLVVKEKVVRIPGGNVKNCRLNLHSFGFEAAVDFWVHCDDREDPLFKGFVQKDPIEARLSIQGVHNLPEPAPAPIVVKGLVTEKSVSEFSFEEVSGSPVLLRQYAIQFKDYAQVLWRQHFPTTLYTDAKMREVVKEHRVEGISLSMSWRVLEAERPMICLGLGQDEASFYDFLVWFIESHGGLFNFDYTDQFYLISDTKPEGGRPTGLRGPEVAQLTVRYPETPRFNRRLLNSSTELPIWVPVNQDGSISGISQDVLVRTPIAAELYGRRTSEAARLGAHGPELLVAFNQYPVATLSPGCLVYLMREFFSDRTYPVGNTFRAYDVCISAQAVNSQTDRDRDAAFTEYQVEMAASLELEDEPHQHLPPFRKPRYPISVEGKIVCDMGKSGDRLYMMYRDESTSQDFYKVNIPLWNKDVFVPFEPHFISGHFYIPAFKDSRVLVELHFDHATIGRLLDWGADVRLPLDGQGNHILFGKNSTSETSVKHVYEDGKPVLSIRRIKSGDIELIKMEEGGIVLETREDEALRKFAEEFDLTPKVAMSRAKLTMGTKAAITGVTGSFEKASSELTSDVAEAVTRTKVALQGMKQEVSAKTKEIDAKVTAAIGLLSEKTAAIKGDVEAAKAELKKMIAL